MAAETESARRSTIENQHDEMVEIGKVATTFMKPGGAPIANEALIEVAVAEAEIFEATHEARTDGMAVDRETMAAESDVVRKGGWIPEVTRRDCGDR